MSLNKLSILKTKFIIPKLKDYLINREKLLDVISSSSEKKLTFISAPAGYGKSTLLIQWAQKNSHYNICWFSLDEHDNDLKTFACNLVYSIREVHKKFGKDILSLLLENNTINPQYIFTILINEILSLSNKLIIIFDDFHLITNSLIYDSLYFLLNRMPSNLYLIISSRENNLSLYKQRSEGELNEIDLKSLAFSLEEIEILFKNQGFELELDTFSKILRDTEGWILSLQLILSSIKDKDSLDKLFENFKLSHIHINDYLISEFINKLDYKIGMFLLKTSAFYEFNSSLCVYSDISDESSEIINYLIKKNIFIIPLDNTGEWYRYHNLFKDLLNKLLIERYPEVNKQIHIKASEWFRKNNMIKETIYHLYEVNDWEKISLYIKESVYKYTTKTGDYYLLFNCFNKIPTNFIYSDIILSVFYLWSLNSTFNYNKLEIEINIVEKNLQNITKDKELEFFSYEAQIIILKVGLLIRKSNYNEAFILVNEALEKTHNDNEYIKTLSLYYLSFLHNYYDNLEKSLYYIDKCIEFSQINKNYMLQIKSFRIKFLSYLKLGYIDKCQNTINEINVLIKQKNIKNLEINLCLWSDLANINYYQNNIDIFYDFYNKSMLLLEKISEIHFIFMIYYSYLEKTIKIKNINESYRLISKIEEKLTATQIENYYNLKVLFAKFQILLLEDNKFEAQKILNIISENVDINTNIDYKLSLINFYRKSGDFNLAYNLLQELLENIKHNNNTILLMELLIIKVDILLILGYIEEPIEILIKALIISEKTSYIRIFLDNYTDNISLLLKSMLDNNTINISANIINHLKKIILLFDKSIDITKQETISLTKREIEIIQMMEKEYSNLKISELSFVSINTIKSHKKNIYKKLDVKSNEMAVFKAKQLKII